MIVDTSALMAVVMDEDGADRLLTALVDAPGLLPGPALVEFERVTSGGRRIDRGKADAMLADLLRRELSILPFTSEHARVAAAANRIYGAGVAIGGTLNLLDLMVYACAKVERRPILCTGHNFRTTDALIHLASRSG